MRGTDGRPRGGAQHTLGTGQSRPRVAVARYRCARSTARFASASRAPSHFWPAILDHHLPGRSRDLPVYECVSGTTESSARSMKTYCLWWSRSAIVERSTTGRSSPAVRPGHGGRMRISAPYADCALGNPRHSPDAALPSGVDRPSPTGRDRFLCPNGVFMLGPMPIDEAGAEATAGLGVLSGHPQMPGSERGRQEVVSRTWSQCAPQR